MLVHIPSCPSVKGSLYPGSPKPLASIQVLSGPTGAGQSLHTPYVPKCCKARVPITLWPTHVTRSLMPQYLCAKPVWKQLLGICTCLQGSPGVSSFRRPPPASRGSWFPSSSHLTLVSAWPQCCLHCPYGLLLPPPGGSP